jgi:hypothetical protein
MINPRVPVCDTLIRGFPFVILFVPFAAIKTKQTEEK